MLRLAKNEVLLGQPRYQRGFGLDMIVQYKKVGMTTRRVKYENKG
jgi:hypothetical protein